jgi:hypothetical protein
MALISDSNSAEIFLSSDAPDPRNVREVLGALDPVHTISSHTNSYVAVEADRPYSSLQFFCQDGTTFNVHTNRLRMHHFHLSGVKRKVLSVYLNCG